MLDSPAESDDRRPRRRRRELITGASAFVAVAAAVAVVVTLTHGAGRTEPADDRSAPIDAQAMYLMAEHLFSQGRVPTSGTFVDATHGYLMVGTCPSLEQILTCKQRLVATSDGGASFSERTLPTDVAGPGLLLGAFDADHLVLDQPASVDYTKMPTGMPTGMPSGMPSGFPGLPSGWPTDPAQWPSDPASWPSGPDELPSDLPTAFPDLPKLPAARWISGDAGRTWQKVSPTPGAAVTALPEGDLLYAPSAFTGGEPGSAMAIGADGVTHPLRNAPSVGQIPISQSALINGFARPVGGSLFLTSDGYSGILTVSRDRGASWQPVDAHGADGLSVLGGDDSILFGAADNTSSDTIAHTFYASRDGGLTWNILATPEFTPVTEPSGGSDPFPGPVPSDGGGDPAIDEHLTSTSDFVSASVVSGGRLLLTDGAKAWTSDGGAFQRLTEDKPTMLTLDLGGAVLGVRGTVTDPGLYLTTDGRHWTPLGL